MSIVLTRTQNIRPLSNLDKNEIRGSRYGVLDAFLLDTDAPGSIVTEDLKTKFFASIGSTVETPVIDYNGGISIGNTRSITISDSENTSAMQTITASTYSFGFTMIPTLFHNNEIGYQQDFDAKFWGYVYLLASTIDSACATALNTAKTQVFNDYLSYPDPTGTGDVVVADLAKELRVVSEVNVMMEANDYFRGLRLIGNGGFQSINQRTLQHGKFNDEDKARGLAGKTFHYSHRVTNGAGHGATFYAVEQGSVGIISRVDRESLYRIKSKAAGREWDVITLPILDLQVGTMYYESDGDWNAIAGAASADMVASHKEHFGFSVDIAILTAYNSDVATLASPIMKFAVSTT